MNSSKAGLRALSVSAIMVFATSVIGSIVCKVGIDLILLNGFLSFFFWGKFILGMMYCQGWKVFNWKAVAGMPRPLFIFYVIVATILVSMGYAITKADLGADQKNLVSFLITAGAGVTGSYIAWYAGINRWMAHGSKYDAIMEFKAKGYSKDVIDHKVTQLENAGVIPISITKCEVVS